MPLSDVRCAIPDFTKTLSDRYTSLLQVLFVRGINQFSMRWVTFKVIDPIRYADRGLDIAPSKNLLAMVSKQDSSHRRSHNEYLWQPENPDFVFHRILNPCTRYLATQDHL